MIIKQYNYESCTYLYLPLKYVSKFTQNYDSKFCTRGNEFTIHPLKTVVKSYTKFESVCFQEFSNMSIPGDEKQALSIM